MRKFVFTIIAIIAAMLTTACDIETSDNGDFDGFWHLERVDTLDTGGTLDTSKDRVFWGVQAKLISVRDIDIDASHGYYLRFRQTHDSIITYSPYKDNWHQDKGENGGDIPIVDPALLAHYGINNIEEGFAKERLKGECMILKSKKLRLHFRKF